MSEPDDPLSAEEADAALAAEYVLRLLGPEEEATAGERERRDPAFAEEVAAWRARFAALDAATEPVAPSPALWETIDRRLFGARPSGWRRLWESARFWRPLATASAAGAMVLGFVHFSAHRPLPGELVPQLISDLAPADAARGTEFLALVEPPRAMLRMVRVAGEPAAGRDFQLWFIAAGGAPVSLGVLPDGERAWVALDRELAHRIAAGGALAVSDEPEGGSPTGAPTGDVLAAGPLRGL